MDRPGRDDYYMHIALAVRRRANCVGSRVGALLVRDDRVIATGYNGTPEGLPNCDEGGCARCANRDRYPPGEAYDLCVCVHAEQNTLLAAARFGVAVEGAVLYTTMRPCFGCAKEMLQARVTAVRYLHPWEPRDHDAQRAYHDLMARFPDGCAPVDVPDPDADWAIGGGANEPARS